MKSLLANYKEDIEYYTPSIEEFHVGFEYETLMHKIKTLDKPTQDGNEYVYTIKDLGEEWTKVYYEGSSLNDYEGEGQGSIQNDIQNKEIRVKYLDKEDIESLGFTIDTEGPHSYMSFTKNNYWLQCGSFTEDASIQLSIQNIDMKEFIFWGVIKNKSELKTLLKWLQIT